MTNKVMIGCPVRNRAWVLPAYLKHLHELQCDDYSVEYCFIINDCTDETPQILHDFAAKQSRVVKLITADSTRAIKPGFVRGSYNFSHLAWLRNILLKEFLKSDCTYLFSVDSDILVRSNALLTLLEDNCDIISALVCNGHQLGDTNLYNILQKSADGSLVHIKDFPRDRVFAVDCTGAAYLIHRRVIADLGVHYSAQWGAEDIGFCEIARQKGLKIYCDGRVECIHLMDEI